MLTFVWRSRRFKYNVTIKTCINLWGGNMFSQILLYIFCEKGWRSQTYWCFSIFYDTEKMVGAGGGVGWCTHHCPLMFPVRNDGDFMLADLPLVQRVRHIQQILPNTVQRQWHDLYVFLWSNAAMERWRSGVYETLNHHRGGERTSDWRSQGECEQWGRLKVSKRSRRWQHMNQSAAALPTTSCLCFKTTWQHSPCEGGQRYRQLHSSERRRGEMGGGGSSWSKTARGLLRIETCKHTDTHRCCIQRSACVSLQQQQQQQQGGNSLAEGYKETRQASPLPTPHSPSLHRPTQQSKHAQTHQYPLTALAWTS